MEDLAAGHAFSCMDVRKRIGSNVQALRRGLGLTQEELAATAEVHQTYLSGVELGKRNPSVLVLQRIALALNADIEELTRKEKHRVASSK